MIKLSYAALMEESTEESMGLVERICAIDIGKAGLVVCVRVPHMTKAGRRVVRVQGCSVFGGGPGVR